MNKNEKPYGLVYKATSPSGKIYIGQTTDPLAVRKLRHTKHRDCPLIHNAIIKYGDEIKWEVIYYAYNMHELNDAEEYFIDHYKCRHPNGYNLRSGGKSQLHHEDTKAQISETLMNHDVSDATKALQSQKRKEGAANGILPMKGKKHSADTKQILSDKNKGVNNPNYGLKRSADTRAKQSESAKKRHAENPMTDETKAKIGKNSAEMWQELKADEEAYKEYTESLSIAQHARYAQMTDEEKLAQMLPAIEAAKARYENMSEEEREEESAKRSAIAKKQWENDEFRAKQSASRIALWEDEEYRNRLVKAHTGKKASDDTKAKMSASQKARQQRIREEKALAAQRAQEDNNLTT